ncbi:MULTISPECIES: nucleotide-binding protein [Pseudonocardia]|uniref:CobQ/CobB/MinD/ParA nucleotide binding domain protein n=2 Tax=Pseudonocardia TaxID=1847 RepID=A0A1Y2MIC9_PSEAH|nr:MULTISPECIES: hypothetical protein [Pseudonocardia]OSY34912.1 CobQ/CobB/MinD/ParA nucleotide binding domain protein [Pseudonocardia autotrophica]TDN76975.1 MinD-like ATPase involved in chromosome partitioning or flagellar assembly [Pseudonocardia autotrophica]BBG00979.1 hypothetical protein Pdca_21880 [Pseudonocardia autotrophica]GEC29120.1 hypothetical protein PSA01_61490 [Pseudonocardia saturnea]
MDTVQRVCALPGCGARVAQAENRSARLYCTPEHRAAARRLRSAHARRGRDGGPGDGGTPARGHPPDRSTGPPDRTTAELSHDSLVRPAGGRAPSVLPAARPLGDWLDRDPGQDAESRRAELRERVAVPVRGPVRVAVLSVKGGVGKTTVAAGLGLTLAEHRGDRIAALDVAPDPGTLAERLTGSVPGAREQLAGRARVETFGELVAASGTSGRLTVIGSTDEADDVGFGVEDYRRVDAHLARFFDVVVADCGPSVRHGAASAAAAAADAVVVVGSFAVDDASRASTTLRWLADSGTTDRPGDALVVLTCDRRPDVSAELVRSHFARRARGPLEISYDPHLRSGGPIEYERLAESTRDRFLELAAHVLEVARSRTGGSSG